MSPVNKKKLVSLKSKLDRLDNELLKLIKKRSILVNEVLKVKTYKNEIIDIGNDNSPGQLVISGHNSVVDKVVSAHKSLGIKRAIKLTVSAPFHCSLMNKAAEDIQRFIYDLEILSPELILINNVDAITLTEPIKIKDSLIKQISKTVRWRESIQKMND